MAEEESLKSRFCAAATGEVVEPVLEVVATRRQEVSTEASDIAGIGYRERLKEMGDRFAALKEKYPEFKEKPYLVLCREGDPEIDRFLEDCSLSVLKDLRILYVNKSSFPRLDIAGRWEAYAAKAAEREEYRVPVLEAPCQEISFGSIYSGIVAGVEKMAPVVDSSDKLGSIFDEYLDPKALMAVYINEIAPPDIEGNRYSRKARVEMYRMFLEAGFQVQKVPAIYDKDGVSFGLDQETLETHNGLMEKHGKEVAGLINSEFSEQVNAPQQILRSLLLAYENLTMFEDFILTKIKKEEKTVADLEKRISKAEKGGEKLGIARDSMYFRDFYEMFRVSATPDEKRRFVATMIAAFHNNGNGEAVKSAITKVVEARPGTLTEARDKFLGLIGGSSAGGFYTRKTNALYESIEGAYLYDYLVPMDFQFGSSDGRRSFKTLEEMGF